MGLDWTPLGRPLPGHEPEFERLVLEIRTGQAARAPGLAARLLGTRRLSERELAARRRRFGAISEPAWAALGAPRVGFDAAADAWLRARLEAGGRLGELEQARAAMQGYHVLDLLPPCDGFPLYSNSGLFEGVERTSFRGQFLLDAEAIIGTPLLERGYEVMLARELAAYADDLEALARPWAERAGVAAQATATKPPEFGEDDPASQAHILFSAIRWCRFWAARGHGLDPDW